VIRRYILTYVPEYIFIVFLYARNCYVVVYDTVYSGTKIRYEYIIIII